jgi:exoribonuclease R
MLQTKNYKDFVIVDENDNIIKEFSGARLANKALPGDKVEITETGCKLIERVEHPMLAGVIELNSKTKYGFTSHNKPIYLFNPFNESYPPFVVGCGHRDTTKNRLALIKFDTWIDTFPRGNLQHLLDEGADEQALFWNYTPYACEKYKGDLPESVLDKPNYTNKPKLKAFNIDPPDCRDVDDVLTIEYQDTKTYIIITISDVATQIPQGHPLDIRAQKIGQTFYQDGNKPCHVFPKEMSEDRLSLLPSETYRPGLSLKFALEDPTNVIWFESLVQTTQTFTYDTVYENESICTCLKRMAEALGEPTEDSHVWIEIAMKFYNQEAAKILKKQKAGFLRCHDKPNSEKLETLMKINPDLKFLAFSSADYVLAGVENPFHYGLQTQYYTHATSPIRRYADLVNQRVIKAFINNELLQSIHVKPNYLNYISKQAKRHDRDLTFIRSLKSASVNRVNGQILTITYNDTIAKITIYIPQWQFTVKLRYKLGNTPNEIISKDETSRHIIEVGQHVCIQYHADMTARSWKKRMVFRLL